MVRDAVEAVYNKKLLSLLFYRDRSCYFLRYHPV